MLSKNSTNANDSLFINTVLGNKSNQTPIWFMRQAGRYLPEYKKVRATTNNFLEFCYNPDKACEVTLQPLKRFDFDAAIIFSDILVIPDALGMEVKFVKNEGPKIAALQDDKDIANLQYDAKLLAPVYQAITQTKDKLPDGKALIGFAGAPWTLATYMIEGGGSKDYLKTKSWSYSSPDSFAKIINILVDSISQHLIAQIEAGVDALQIFDSWAGVLTEEQFAQWSIEPTRQIVANVRSAYPDIPIIGFPKGVGVFYKDYASATDINAISFDQHMSAKWIRDNIDVTVQGNLDPVLLMNDKNGAVEQTKKILATMEDKPFIFNLGHGILQHTPIENVEAVVNIVKNSR